MPLVNDQGARDDEQDTANDGEQAVQTFLNHGVDDMAFKRIKKERERGNSNIICLEIKNF